jgi:hypothetical protein
MTDMTDRTGLHPMWSSHQERAQAIADLTDRILEAEGGDPPGEGYLEKVGRLNNARSRAAEIVAAQEAETAESDSGD